MLYRVTSRSGLKEFALSLKPTHLVSLIDPESPAPDRPSGVAAADHLLFRFHDLDTTDAASGGPTAEVADALVAFALRLQAEARVLVHCEAGISRSTAAALVLDLATPGLACRRCAGPSGGGLGPALCAPAGGAAEPRPAAARRYAAQARRPACRAQSNRLRGWPNLSPLQFEDPPPAPQLIPAAPLGFEMLSGAGDEGCRKPPSPKRADKAYSDERLWCRHHGADASNGRGQRGRPGTTGEEERILTLMIGGLRLSGIGCSAGDVATQYDAYYVADGWARRRGQMIR